MKKTLLFFMVFTIFIALFPVKNSFAQQSEPMVKVKLINFLGNKTEITLKPNGDYTTSDTNIVLTSGSTYLLKQVDGKLSLYKDEILLNSSDTFSAKPVDSRTQLSINNRLYLGSFDFEVENKQFVRPTNTVKMEDYLKGVVPIEMYPSWNIEALKTQAVAARTFAMSYINRGIINDTISYQVYGGYNWTPNTTKAVDETKGQVAQSNGRLIDAVYSASNGGLTESNANAWGVTAVPYLTVKQDSFDPKTVWSFSFKKTQIDLTTKDLSKPSEWWSATKEADATISSNIKMWLNNNGYVNKDIKIIAIPEFTLQSAGSGGRMTKGNITMEFLVKDKVDAEGKLVPQSVSLSNASVSKIRSVIGNRMMLSYLVDEMNTDTNTVIVKGRGDGHGVGMSQWGAKYMADAGKNYDEILKFYYTGITVVKMYEPTSQTVNVTSNPISAQINQAGWVKDSGKWYYIKTDGTKAAGWLKDANQWYYLNQVGVMLTGWQKVGGKWYYLKPSGAMATSWLKDKNKWYFLTASGSMATGWIKDKGKSYYLNKDGAMVENKQFIDGKWYLFHSSGYLIR